MSLFTVLLVLSVVGLGLVALWWASGLNMVYSGWVGSLVQGIIVTPMLAVGGVAAFLLFGYVVGVPEVPLISLSGLQDVLILITVASVIGGIFLGMAGYFCCKWFD